MSLNKQMDLYIEVNVLTAGTIAEVVNAILESLLYQRNQIPFVYKTFRYYVNKWLQQEETQSNIGNEDCAIQHFHVQRIKQQAINTIETISAMKEIIKNTFKKKRVKSLRFLFGSTVFTAKEAYTVYIPTEDIAVKHFHNNHIISPDKLNQALLSLLTNEDLYAIFSHNMKPTNIYLELEILESHNENLMACKDSIEKLDIFPKDFSTLPGSCKDIHINLVHKQSSTIEHNQLLCCKELAVFEDLSSLNLKCDSEQKEDIINNKNDKSLINSFSWWETEIVVRGFKNQSTKDTNIWS